MEKILNFGTYKRRRVMRPSYITARLEDLAHDISVATWVFYSPSSTEEERMRANNRLRRLVYRVTRYHSIEDCGGMGRWLCLRYDDRRFLDFVENANRIISNRHEQDNDMEIRTA